MVNMNFVAALKCGAKPEVEAARCMKQLLGRSGPQDGLDLVVTADFINELYKAIELKSNITAQQLETGELIEWDTAYCSTYVFHCNTIFFSAFECFLEQLSGPAREQFTSVKSKAVQLYIKLMGIWLNCCTDLLRQCGNIQVPFLTEPLSRMNYIFFNNVHEIRKKFKMDIDVVNTICTGLWDSALQGLFYVECHKKIAISFSTLIEKDFTMSKAFNDDAYRFYRVVFRVDKELTTSSGIFQCLIRMMYKLSLQRDGSNYRQLVGFLIDSPMQEIYYTFLRVGRRKCLPYATLNFLKNLLPHLLDLSCFSQTFLEAILDIVLRTNENLSFIAAELYIKMARRMSNSDDYILKHIMEYYFREQATAVAMTQYVKALWAEFPHMQSMKIYFGLLADSGDDIPLDMRYFIASFSVVVYQKIFEYRDERKYAKEFLYVFKTLPKLLETLNTQCLKGILLQLYNFTPQNALCERCALLNELLPNFEDYFVASFRGDKHLQYPYLHNLVAQFARCIEKTNHFDKVEKCVSHVYSQYKDMECQLQALDTEKALSSRKLSAYCYILQKVSVLLQVEFDVFNNFDQLEDIMQTLYVRLIQTTQIYEFAAEGKIFIDIYATNLFVYGCIKSSRNKDLTDSSRTWLAGVLRDLETYLINFLTQAKITTNEDMYRVKTYFNCLAILYYTFHNCTDELKLQLNLHSYRVLVETLLTSCLQREPQSTVIDEEDMELHPNFIINYQNSMFVNFTQLHTMPNMVLPSPVAWKLCLHYGLRSHKFSDELLTFMNVLTKYHFKILTHILGVSAYNLYKQNPAFKMDEILSVIRAHKSFIDRLPFEYKPALVCANVVLSVLKFLQQSLDKTESTTDGNRLAALKHLNLYIENLNVNANNVLPDIHNHTEVLRKHLLNTAEQTSLREYLFALEIKAANIKNI